MTEEDRVNDIRSRLFTLIYAIHCLKMNNFLIEKDS